MSRYYPICKEPGCNERSAVKRGVRCPQHWQKHNWRLALPQINAVRAEVWRRLNAVSGREAFDGVLVDFVMNPHPYNYTAVLYVCRRAKAWADANMKETAQ
jgi:hypothetical protein